MNAKMMPVMCMALAMVGCVNAVRTDEPAVSSDARRSLSYLPGSAEPDQQILKGLRGSFTADKDGPLEHMWNAAAIHVEGMGNATYIEVWQWLDVHQYIAQVYSRKDGPCIRLYELKDQAGLASAIRYLWAAPEAFVPLRLEQLRPIADIAMAPRSQNGDPDKMEYTGKSAYPTLVQIRGAVESTIELRLMPDALAIVQRGYDAQGELVWRDGTLRAMPDMFRGQDLPIDGYPASVTGKEAGQVLLLKRTEPFWSVTKSDGGVTIIQFSKPGKDAIMHEPGDEVTVEYVGWLADGTEFDCSTKPGGQPLKAVIPGRLIQGWNEGLNGIAIGESRKLVIPPAAGYGDRGAARGLIPANATLIFDVICTHVNKAKKEETPSNAGSSQPDAFKHG